MRLLNIAKRTLNEFSGEVPPYAILSHCWGEEEVTFQDWQAGRAEGMRGFLKIKGCCAQASLDGLEYVWIDTCCIDKSSSSELSEAINSMFRWYQEALVCYVYLVDVPHMSDGPYTEELKSAFQKSRWFTRGWTLQELLSPKHLVFFNPGWASLGTRSDMKELISRITGIMNLDNYSQECIAAKMSWASKRHTTREEDRAYSLMGLFGVFMTPMYGEGQNAFYRLQLELLTKSDDESIFAWKSDSTGRGGLLAKSLNAFKHSGDVCLGDFGWNRAPYSMTNKGLRLELPLLAPRRWDDSIAFGDAILAPLNCLRRWSHEPLAVCLQRVGHDKYLRVSMDRLVTLDSTSGSRFRIRVSSVVDSSDKFDDPAEDFEILIPAPVIFVKHDDVGVFYDSHTFSIMHRGILPEGFSHSGGILSRCISHKTVNGKWDTNLGAKSLSLGADRESAALFFTHDILGNIVVIVSVYVDEASVEIRLLRNSRNLQDLARDDLKGPEWRNRSSTGEIRLAANMYFTARMVKLPKRRQRKHNAIYLNIERR